MMYHYLSKHHQPYRPVLSLADRIDMDLVVPENKA